MYDSTRFEAVRLRSILGLAMLVLASALLGAPLLAQEGMRKSPDGDGWVSITTPHRHADVFLDSDRFTGAYTLTPHEADIGRTAKLVVVARVNDRWYSHDGVRWQSWNSARMADLPTFAVRTLAAKELLSIIADSELAAGDYSIFAGYQVTGGPLVYNNKPLQFSIQSKSSDMLLPFSSDTAMEAYLKDGLQNGAGRYDRGYERVATTAAATPTAGTNAGQTTASRTSMTNVQEVGVDEADSIKVDGSTLYMLANCDDKTCLQAHTLDSSTAKASLLASFKLGSTVSPNGMFLVDKGILGKKMLVTMAGQNSGGGWFRIWGWDSGKTEIEFIDVTSPQTMSSIEKLKIEGTLVSSRRVGNTLYVVTRYTPAIAGFYPYAYDKAQLAQNAAVLEKTSLPAMLPSIEDSRKKIDDLVKSKNCYLPTSAVDGNYNPSIITITSVPLDAPTQHASTCFLGASETLYMTPQSLYLATTSWNYDAAAMAGDALVYSPSHTTSVHKFALANGKVDYRGSGEVKGHLGWDQDKKSFRMGEHNGYLNIATSIGDTWRGTSSTSLSVLKEITGSKKLQTVKVIDGIGLKGEQLYAARFVGDRGYLVTFRVTDPLYVIDLSNQEQPYIAGELKIDGYSDYLHPVSDTLLLGIGKDAIPDRNSSDEGGRGAWYQGVKLSLFDVSNITSPKEVDNLVLGKRGTQSDVLYDHHALSFLPAVGNEPARLAIPVQLHDTVPTWEWFKAGEPSAWYDYTHTALYSFEISKLGITQAGRLISDLRKEVPLTDKPQPRPAPTVVGTTATGAGSTSSSVATSRPAEGASILPVDPLVAPIYVYFNDRSVLKNDSVFYIHDGKVLSSKWGESK